MYWEKCKMIPVITFLLTYSELYNMAYWVKESDILYTILYIYIAILRLCARLGKPFHASFCCFGTKLHFCIQCHYSLRGLLRVLFNTISSILFNIILTDSKTLCIYLFSLKKKEFNIYQHLYAKFHRMKYCIYMYHVFFQKTNIKF